MASAAAVRFKASRHFRCRRARRPRRCGSKAGTGICRLGRLTWRSYCTLSDGAVGTITRVDSWEQRTCWEAEYDSLAASFAENVRAEAGHVREYPPLIFPFMFQSALGSERAAHFCLLALKGCNPCQGSARSRWMATSQLHARTAR